MWMYKVCKGKKNNYCVIGRYENKRDAEIHKKDAEFYYHYKENIFVKRYSEKEG